MGHIVVEFYSPNAKTRARDWKKEIIEAITAAILKLESNGAKLFTEQEIAVYFTFQEEKSLPDAPLAVMTLLSLPDHLRKTAMTLCRMGRATADEVSGQTKRARAVESAYLNQLVIMGYLKKERNGRKAYFFVERTST